jgi:hypothetical protein
VGAITHDRLREEARRMKRGHKIDGQFAPRTIAMLRSPAFRVLSLSAHRILARIEIELASHGGKDNGRLPITFTNFEQFGISDRHVISRGIRELCALGFVERTRGRSGNAERRTPNLFRLTYLPAGGKAPTHDWRRIKTIEQAEKVARGARRTIKRKKFPSGEKPHCPVVKNHTGVSGEKPHCTSRSPVVKNHTTSRQSSHLVYRAFQQGHRLSGQPQSGTTPRRSADGGDPVPFHRTNQRRNSHVKN